MNATEIKAKIEALHRKARNYRDPIMQDKYHCKANTMENHYFMLLNPEQATSENIAHAIKFNFWTP